MNTRQRRYRRSPRGKAATARYEATPAAKARKRRYARSEKGPRWLRRLYAEQAQKRLASKREWNPLGLIFCTPEGTPINLSNLRNRDFAELVTLAKVPRIRLHDLRHTATTFELSQGLDLDTVSKRRNHKRLSTTADIYSHWTQTRQEWAAAVSNGILTIPSDLQRADQ